MNASVNLLLNTPSVKVFMNFFFFFNVIYEDGTLRKV